MEGSAEGTAHLSSCGWHHIACNGSRSVENRSITSNGPIFSSNSTTKEVERCMAAMSGSNHSIPPDPPQHCNDANTIGSVGSRVPFSWAEITKIQPKFHNESATDTDHQKPKVFDQTPKIATRHLQQSRAPTAKRGTSYKAKVAEEDIPMPSIPESDPFANRNDLGRRVRKSGKKGSRLKYANGKKGGNRNRRKRNTK